MPIDSSRPQPQQLDAHTVETAIEQAIHTYFCGCRERIDPFIKHHFRYPGAWHTNKSALGWDLLRAPFNLFWAPFYMCGQLSAWLLRRLGFHRLHRLLRRTPAGFTTTVQIKVADLIATEVLLQGGDSSQSLKALILQALDDLVEPEVNNRDLVAKLAPVIDQALRQYGITRTASADITNSLLSTVLGAFAFKKFTPGGFAIGLLLASRWAQQAAIDNFFLGNFFGEIYYGLFPAEPSLQLSIVSTALVLACLATFASFSGLITDPIQSWIGLHKYRLKKMLRHLQRDMLAQSNSSFSPKDAYVARILELLDAAKSQLL